MKYYIVLVLFIVSQLLWSQYDYKTESKKAIKNFEEGMRLYNLNYYPLAAQFFKDAIQADSGFQNAYLALAEVLWDQQKIKDAVQAYEVGLKMDPGFYPNGYLNKGKLERQLMLYNDAIESFNTFISLVDNDNKYLTQAKQGIKHAKFALWALEHPVNFKPENLGSNINSRDDEYWPSISADGHTLVITRKVEKYDIAMGKQEQEDFFFSTYENGKWLPMRNAGAPLNTPGNEGAQSITADGRFMVYTVCNRKGVIGRCDLYYSEKNGNTWTRPKNMGAPINTVAKETQPSISADGRTLYFASNRKGTKGNLDIWVSYKTDDGTWTEPKNLGDTINTSEDEMSPFIHYDNKTLYFASKEHPGMGGFDIFMTQKNSSGIFDTVINLGYPINTQTDEMGLVVNAKGNMAFYSSGINKANGRDIYQFEMPLNIRPDEVSYMKGKVFDDSTLVRLKASFELFDLSSGNLISKAESDERTGEFLLCIPTNRNYMLNVQHRGYLFYSDNFALKGVHHVDKPFLKDVPLQPIYTGKSIILKNIFYETDSYALQSESTLELDKIVEFMQLNSSIHIEISGHTDNIGSESYNTALSENRAESVVEYLVSKGIESKRLSFHGYGYSKPIDTNETEAGRANNRRTELKILHTLSQKTGM